MTNEVQAAAERNRFEEAVFRERFLKSIKRNPSPPHPKISGALDFVSVDCPNKSEFLARDAAGNYIDESVSAMWFGFQLAASVDVPADSDLPIDEAWLRSVGFTECDDSLRNQKSFRRGIVLCIALATEGPKCWTWHLEIAIGRGRVTIAIDPTRGDLRLLCRALSIPLAESPSAAQRQE